MSGGVIVEHIDAVDAFARTLYVRAKQASNPSLSADVASAVRQLHLDLRHLRVEAADPDSLLNRSEPSVYSKQLHCIVKDSETALKQLESVLDRFGDVDDHYVEGMADSVAAVHSTLTHEKAVIDVFLDLVQLDGSANIGQNGVVDTNQPSFDNIKDKVDIIGRRLFNRRNSNLTTDDDGLWHQFKIELEKEGFSAKVLDEHKDILRAYIREVESMSSMNGGATPTVRGLLECEARSGRTYGGDVPSSVHDGDKAPTSMKTERLMPDEPPIVSLAPQFSFDRQSVSSDENSDAGGSLSLISTWDLMAMDALNADMAGLQLQSPNSYLGTSPNRSGNRLAPYAIPGALAAPAETELSRSANSQLGGLPPPPHLHPSYANGAQQHTYGSSAPSAYSTGHPMSRLAPDSYGREIPVDAQWTKIKRSLVSPEVLARARVRYEARPDYVAILGRLSRDEIAEYARLSAECRSARQGKPQPRRREHKHERTGSESSRDEDDDMDLLHRSDTTDSNEEKGTKSYPVIVNPPDKNKTSPSSTVMPKPILKNKNTNHVRFGPNPYEVDPRADKEDRDRRDNGSRRHRDRDDRDRDRDDHRRREDGRGRRDSDRYSDDRRHRDDDHYRSHRSDRDRDRRDDRRGDRPVRRKAWGETLGAVGIGGAAASLLGVLAEAAIGG